MGPKRPAATPDIPPTQLMPAFTVGEHCANAGAAFHCADGLINSVMDAFEETLHLQALETLVVPFTCEASLSQALEPSLLYHFYPDYKEVILEDGEDDEPSHIEIDCHCQDKYKGKENLATRKNSIEVPDGESTIGELDGGAKSALSR